jgi:lipoic acid synthetase
MNKPEWFRKVIRSNDLIEMRGLIRENKLNTVCEEAACPNRGECYKNKTLTVHGDDLGANLHQKL